MKKFKKIFLIFVKISEYPIQIWDHFICRKVWKLMKSEETCLIDKYGPGPYKKPRQSFKVR